ncbi:MAG: hypothetical protein FJZ92_01355 [Chloroflexi bacterium]|nr:hypothetical protein [Chloroflexota bacterium]
MRSDDGQGWQRRLSRRQVLATGATGLGALGLWMLGCSDEKPTTPAKSVGTPTPVPAKSALPPGERIPNLTIVYPSGDFWTESLRKFTTDWEKIGLKFNLVPVSNTEWLAAIFDRRYGDIETHGSPLRPERFDPTEWIVSRAYGPEGEPGKRNYGNYKSKAYDAAVETQLKATDVEKRREAVFKAQQVLREDYYTHTLVYDKVAEAYNAADWEPVAPAITGNGLFGDLVPYGLLQAKPKGTRKRFTIGQTALVDTTNIVATTGGGRNILRLVYDTLVKLDTDLSVRGWAMESWKKVDDVTWDMKLRPGMKWHDGRPVTPEDVVFTFERLKKEQPGILSLVWRPVKSVQITDAGAGVVRFNLEEPRADFLTIVAMIAVILPKHIWEGAPKLTDFVVNSPATAIGSGPFQWVDYRKDDQLLLKRNPNHFSPPVMDELLYLVAPTVDGNMGRLQAKQIDRMLIPTKSLLDQAGKFSHVKTLVTKDLGWYLMLPFVERMPWRDIELRKAWFHATDKKFSAEVVLEGLADVADTGTFMSPAGFWGNPKLDPIGFDMAKARDILVKAGYSWDSSGRLLYPNAEDADYKRRIEQVTSRPNDWWGPKAADVGPPGGRV